MRAVVTRVDAASVSIGSKTAGEIGAGLLILLGMTWVEKEKKHGADAVENAD